MKPIHEQEWEHDGHGIVWNKGRIADLVHRPTEGHSQGIEEVLDRGDLISAAPDMARALISVLYRQGDADSREKMARAALIKAGVIPTQLPPASSDNQS